MVDNHDEPRATDEPMVFFTALRLQPTVVVDLVIQLYSHGAQLVL